MSRETEKANGGANLSLEEHNAGIMSKRKTPTAPTTSDDYMDLADSAKNDKDRLRYAKQALELDPDNLDA